MSIERELLQRSLDTIVLSRGGSGDWLLTDEIRAYLAQPKQEPIEDGELEVWYSQHTWAMDKQEYMWGFRDAEKAHGIGE